MAPSTSIPAGFVLSGKYLVGREIGRGGMAAVYEAQNLDIGKRVAIKALAGHLASSATVVERFLREARAVAKIRSPHICDVFDVGKLEDGTPFLVLELLEGESLYDAMVRDRQMSEKLTLAIVLQCCRGLAKAHEAGIVHRDLKPENIFLTVDGDGDLLVKILDFGLAKFYEQGETEKRGRAARLTRDGAVFGTPVYMSPEQVRGQAAADERADLWALACIAYECVTGTTVWSTDDGVAMTFAQIAAAPVPDPRLYRPDLPESFTQWFRRALDRDISQRYQSVQELADGLAAAFRLEQSGLDPGLIDRIAREATGRHANGGPASSLESSAHGASGSAEPGAPASRAGGDGAASRRAPPPPSPPRSGQSAGQTAGQSTGQSAKQSTGQSTGQSAGQSTGQPAGQSVGVRGSPTSTPFSVEEDLDVARLGRRPMPMKAVVAVAAAAALALVAAVVPRGQGNADLEPARSFGGVALRLAERTPLERSGFTHVASHPWLPRVRQAQVQISRGEHERAAAALRRVFDETKHPMVKNLVDQVQVAIAAQKSSARCQVTGIGRPRSEDLLAQDHRVTSAGAPAIALGIGGAVVAWTEPVDAAQRVRAVALDESLRNDGLMADVTPEGARVSAPFLLPIAQRFLLVYGDQEGDRRGAHARWLAPTAAIAGELVNVSASKRGAVDVRAARTSDGGFVVVWVDEPERGRAVLMRRRFDKDSRPIGPPEPLFGEERDPGAAVRAYGAVIEVRDSWLHVAYVVSRGVTQEVRFATVPLDTARPTTPLVVSPVSEKAAAPSLGCVADGCYVAWGDAMRSGVSVAFVTHEKGRLAWHNRFSAAGKQAQIAVAPNGQAQVAWYEGGRVVVAPLGANGIGPESKVARVVGEPPAPSIAPGAQRGEWYLGWLDFESARHEPYVVRVLCP